MDGSHSHTLLSAGVLVGCNPLDVGVVDLLGLLLDVQEEGKTQTVVQAAQIPVESLALPNFFVADLLLGLLRVFSLDRGRRPDQTPHLEGLGDVNPQLAS